MYTLKHLLDSGEMIVEVFENKYCFIFYTIGKNTKFRKNGNSERIRWGMKKDTCEVGSCGAFAQLLDYTNGTPDDLTKVHPEILNKYISENDHG